MCFLGIPPDNWLLENQLRGLKYEGVIKTGLLDIPRRDYAFRIDDPLPWHIAIIKPRSWV
jgi:hypothetical protein